MEILSYLPSASDLKVRAHVEPFKLPISESFDSDAEQCGSEDDPEPGWYIKEFSRRRNGFGSTLR